MSTKIEENDRLKQLGDIIKKHFKEELEENENLGEETERLKKENETLKQRNEKLNEQNQKYKKALLNIRKTVDDLLLKLQTTRDCPYC